MLQEHNFLLQGSCQSGQLRMMWVQKFLYILFTENEGLFIFR